MTVYVVLRAHDGENKESGVGWGVAHTSTDVPGADQACYEYLETLAPAEGAAGVALATVPLRSWEAAVFKGRTAWSRETIKDSGPTADDELRLDVGPAEPAPNAQGGMSGAGQDLPQPRNDADDDVPMGVADTATTEDSVVIGDGDVAMFDGALDSEGAAAAGA